MSRYQFNPSVAQPGSASALGAEGREFESHHSDQLMHRYQSGLMARIANPLIREFKSHPVLHIWKRGRARFIATVLKTVGSERGP